MDPTVEESINKSFRIIEDFWLIDDIKTVKMLETHYSTYVKEREKKIGRDCNFIVQSKDKKWMIDCNISRMNNLSTNEDDLSLIESKSQ